VVPIADPFRPIGELARALPLRQFSSDSDGGILQSVPFQLFRAHALRIGIWLCMQGFFIRSGQILPTHFTTGRGDRFELHSDRFRRWNLAERPIQLFRAHACRTDIWLCMQGFFIRSGQILPTHFTTGRGDRFELHSDRFRRWNLLGRIQCPRRGANPPGFQI
jgi:hypothetical protein